MRSAKARPSISTIGIATKHNVPEAKKLALEAAAFLSKKKVQALIDAPTDEMVRKSDLMLVLGGDGTLLSVARRMISRSIPIMGVNMGHLGFLAELKKEELFSALTAALKGKIPVSERAMLECTLIRGGKTFSKTPVVNDIVLTKGAIARIFDMQVLVDDMLVTSIRGDGLIIATPTGSTAYGLAAGGPIVSPTLAAIEIVPICPHSLTLRPLVLPDTSEVMVIPQGKGGTVVLTLDGQTSVELKAGDALKVSKYKKHMLKLLHSPERSYYSLLREKLKYGYRD